MAKPNTSSYLVKQYANVVNDAYKEVIGDKLTGALDTTDVVTMGRNLDEIDGLDGFYGAITNKITKTVAYVLSYMADGRNIIHDAISYGAFIEKIYVDSIDAVNNPPYSITQSSGTMSNIADPYGVTKTYTITSKIFGGSGTWSLEFNTDLLLIKKAFRSESDMMAFIDSIFVKAQTDIELEKEALVQLAINTGIMCASRGGCVYNTLYRYNKTFNKSLTKDNWYYDADCVKWTNMFINRIVKLMAKPSKNFNPSGYLNASNRNSIELEVLSAFADSSKVFLESGTYHDDKVALSGNYSEVPFWQFNAEDFDVASTVSVENKDLWKNGSNAVTYTQSGIIAIARDKDAVGAIFENDYSWSMPNPRARLTSYGYQFERGFMVEPHANFVVFVADDYDITETLTGVDSVEYVGEWAVGSEIVVTPTPSSTKTMATATYTDGSGAHNMTALTGADTGKYKFTIPVGLTAVTFTAS